MSNLDDVPDVALLGMLDRGEVSPKHYVAQAKRRGFRGADGLALAQLDSMLVLEEVRRRMRAGEIDRDEFEGIADPFGDEVDRFCLEEAAARFRRREVREAIWNLEKALGPDFIGLTHSLWSD